jgi:hypothetical protein
MENPIAMTETFEHQSASSIDLTKPRKPRTPKLAKPRAELLAEFYSLPDQARIDQAMVAAVKHCSEAKLERDRWEGVGLPFIREGGKLVTDKNGNRKLCGGRVYYIKADVLADLEKAEQITHTDAA